MVPNGSNGRVSSSNVGIRERKENFPVFLKKVPQRERRTLFEPWRLGLGKVSSGSFLRTGEEICVLEVLDKMAAWRKG